jgi:hypothetical protein
MALSNRHSAGTIWLPTGNPDTTNISPTDFNSMGGQPGALGTTFEAVFPGRSYQRIVLDSGATAATPTGVVAANQLAYWKDKANYIVTNDSRQAMGGGAAANAAFRNFVAGVFRTAVTAGYVADVVQRGQAISVVSDGNGAIGDTAVCDTSTTTCRVTAVTAGTAPTAESLGIIRAAAANSVISVDLDIPNVQ